MVDTLGQGEWTMAKCLICGAEIRIEDTWTTASGAVVIQDQLLDKIARDHAEWFEAMDGAEERALDAGRDADADEILDRVSRFYDSHVKEFLATH